jgi:hypothetical protein
MESEDISQYINYATALAKFRFPVRVMGFSLVRRTQAHFEAHSAFYPTGIGNPAHGDKMATASNTSLTATSRFLTLRYAYHHWQTKRN